MIKRVYIKINNTHFIHAKSEYFYDYIINKDNVMIPKEKISHIDALNTLRKYKKYIYSSVRVIKDIVVTYDYEFDDYIIRQNYYPKQDAVRQYYIDKIDIDECYRYEEVDNTKMKYVIGTIIKTFNKINGNDTFIILDNDHKDYPFKTDIIVYKCVPLSKDIFTHDTAYIVNDDIKKTIGRSGNLINRIIMKFINKYYN